MDEAAALEARGRTVVFVAADQRMLGLMAIADPIKAESATVVEGLRRMGMRIVMVTGDAERTARAVAAALAWLSEPRDDDIVLDPLCGVGTVLIERAHLGRYAMLLGGDADAEAATYAALKAFEGRPSGLPAPAPDPVNQAMIRHWVEAMGDENPVYLDEGAARAAGRDEQPVDAVGHGLGDAVDARRGDRQAERHRLEEGPARPLPQRRECERVGGRQQVGDVVAHAEEGDRAGQVGGSHRLAERCGGAPFAARHQHPELGTGVTQP